jgi:hypothetical protein
MSAFAESVVEDVVQVVLPQLAGGPSDEVGPDNGVVGVQHVVPVVPRQCPAI